MRRLVEAAGAVTMVGGAIVAASMRAMRIRMRDTVPFLTLATMSWRCAVIVFIVTTKNVCT